MIALLQFISRTTYRKEIMLVLALKLFLLWLLWMFFFSHPADVNLTKEEMAQHFILNK
jgi:hypothetical protein